MSLLIRSPNKAAYAPTSEQYVPPRLSLFHLSSHSLSGRPVTSREAGFSHDLSVICDETRNDKLDFYTHAHGFEARRDTNIIAERNGKRKKATHASHIGCIDGTMK